MYLYIQELIEAKAVDPLEFKVTAIKNLPIPFWGSNSRHLQEQYAALTLELSP